MVFRIYFWFWRIIYNAFKRTHYNSGIINKNKDKQHIVFKT